LDSYTLRKRQTSGRRPFGRWTHVAGLIVFAAAVVLPAGCTSPASQKPHPVVVVGIDGLEWSLVLDMLRAGELPNIARQMERGRYGKLKTQHPSLSPVIWTTVATGVGAQQHGIRGFVKSKQKLFTNRDRKTRALWNIASDNGLASHVIGWWMTYPVEPIRGIMVAQANTTLEQVRQEDGILKGQLVQGLAHQVHPPDLAEPMLSMAADVEKNFDTIVRDIITKIPPDDDPHVALLWHQSRWAIRADEIYERVALDALRRQPDVDLALWYFGGTDVLGHRFWRWTYPKLYKFPPTDESVEAYGSVLRDYYRHTDRRVGKLLAAAPADANIILLSDHGMGPANRKRDYDEAKKPPRSGGHGRTEAFVVFAGPDVVHPGSQPAPAKVAAHDIELLGSIVDVAPTILALLGLPVGEDMAGSVMTSVIAPEFFARHAVRTVPTHTERGWAKSRKLPEDETPGENERLEQLRSLGYIQ
jgi:hypothetical protein